MSTTPVRPVEASPVTATPVSDIRRLARPDAPAIAQAEVERFAALLRSLDAEEWGRRTDCPLWDVRAMAGHVVGMTETFTGLRPFVTTMRAGGKAAGDGEFIDGLTGVQVERNAHLTTGELVAKLEALGPRNARWRRTRRLMRRIPLKQPMSDGTVETWRLAFLLDVVLTRDTWMHRIDVCRATGRELALTPEHDGRIVADAVAEWAERHGRPFTLHLTGPAGGTYTSGDGGESLELDAIEFCRILSHRAPGEALLATEVPF
jgi:uncharacterized protein (TIGR03083 family)